MDYEFIDEDEIVSSRGERKKKKTASLFDSDPADRSYWGNDPGTELTMALARIQIRKHIKNLKLMDVDDHDLTRKLRKEYRDELRVYQLEMLRILITDDVIQVVQGDDGEMLLEIVQPLHLIEDTYNEMMESSQSE